MFIRGTGPLGQEVGDEDGQDGYGGYESDEEIDYSEQAGAEFERSAVGEFLVHGGLFHFPAYEYHEQHASEAHQEVGRELIAEIENGLPEQFEP